MQLQADHAHQFVPQELELLDLGLDGVQMACRDRVRLAAVPVRMVGEDQQGTDFGYLEAKAARVPTFSLEVPEGWSVAEGPVSKAEATFTVRGNP